MPRLALALVLGMLLPGAAATAPADDRAPAASPGGSVQSFYAFHMAHGMGFSPEAVSRRAEWLSPDLVAACRRYFSRPSSPDEVPPIDGDPFTDSQEYPSGFKIEKVRMAGGVATVAVSFSGPEGRKGSVHLALVQAKGAWLVNDVLYVSGPSFRKLLSR